MGTSAKRCCHYRKGYLSDACGCSVGASLSFTGAGDHSGSDSSAEDVQHRHPAESQCIWGPAELHHKRQHSGPAVRTAERYQHRPPSTATSAGESSSLFHCFCLIAPATALKAKESFLPLHLNSAVVSGVQFPKVEDASDFILPMQQQEQFAQRSCCLAHMLLHTHCLGGACGESGFKMLLLQLILTGMHESVM